MDSQLVSQSGVELVGQSICESDSQSGVELVSQSVCERTVSQPVSQVLS